jgi:hypothetical protein
LVFGICLSAVGGQARQAPSYLVAIYIERCAYMVLAGSATKWPILHHLHVRICFYVLFFSNTHPLDASHFVSGIYSMLMLYTCPYSAITDEICWLAQNIIRQFVLSTCMRMYTELRRILETEKPLNKILKLVKIKQDLWMKIGWPLSS